YALIGYGKMGKVIEEILLADASNKIVFRISSANADALTIENLRQADVAIEFTAPHLAPKHLQLCFAAGVPVVCGTTGWYESLAEIKASCLRNKGALVYAPNFSVGVNVFFAINKYAARFMHALPEYRVSISETHHTEKKDAPSGTAIQIADQILQIQANKTGWIKGESSAPDKIPIIAFRKPDIPGTHTIHYDSAIDSITLTHTAHNRKGFAMGAIMAAKWIIGKQGVYTMQDILQLND
ncbi:MAG: 4-hydroxy-tetrahydrodipicolinate reductase, partial [Chitinophagales bacterium]